MNSSYIEEVPEEMEVTTRMSGTVNQKTGFRSGMKMTGMRMTGLMKTGVLMKTLGKSTTKMSFGEALNKTENHFKNYMIQAVANLSNPLVTSC